MMLNVVDVVLIAFTLILGFFGMVAGLLSSVFFFLSGFIGMWAARHFGNFHDIRFYIIFALATALAIICGTVLSKFIGKIVLGAFDRILGAILGIALAVAITAVFLPRMETSVAEKTRKQILSSYTYKKILPKVNRYAPQLKHYKFKGLSDGLPKPSIPKKLDFHFHTPSPKGQ
jgi:uncharacterized membrane protein required for colicin V production